MMTPDEDRYEAVARRIQRSLIRDWLVVAAASVAIGGAFGALAVGSSSLHTMVALSITQDDSNLPSATTVESCPGPLEEDETIADSVDFSDEDAVETNNFEVSDET